MYEKKSDPCVSDQGKRKDTPENRVGYLSHVVVLLFVI